MASQTIWIVDTHNQSSALAEAIASPEIQVVIFASTNQLAQTLASGAVGAVIANIYENEDFETLEHLSKISLTFPEIPLVLLLPEPMYASIDWGPRVFNLIKPVSPESILRRLRYLDEHSYPTRGILQKGYLLALLDYCLLQKKHARISIRYEQKHEIEILIQQGKLHSVYIDHQLKNEKILFPFALDGAEFSVEYIEHDAHTVFDARFAISDDDYRRFRLELHPFLSLMQQFPPMSEVLHLDEARLMQVLSSLPEQVHSVIRYFDGVNDLFRIFTNIDLRPLETAQRIGYLYFSDVFRKTTKTVHSVFDASAPVELTTDVSKPERVSSSSELAAWLLDPVSAARQLETKIRSSLKSKKDVRGSFRPHRKTQPGLGALLRPVGEHESVEEEGSDTGWGGVNTKMQRESREFFRMIPQDDAIPGMVSQEVVIDMEEDDEQASASGVIEVIQTESLPVDAVKSGKIILEQTLSISGESEITTSAESMHPTFHDEPTVPLQPQDEDDLAKESLSELLAMHAEGGASIINEAKDERFRATKQLQAYLIPNEAIPETMGADVPVLQNCEVMLDTDCTPSPAFDEAPNGAITPYPEVAVNDPTPVPQDKNEVSTETIQSSDEWMRADKVSSVQKDVETALNIDTTMNARKDQTTSLHSTSHVQGVLTFQKTIARESRWKLFIVVVFIAVLVIGGYALWGMNSQEMEVTTPVPTNPPVSVLHIENDRSVQANMSMSHPQHIAATPEVPMEATPSLPPMEEAPPDMAVQTIPAANDPISVPADIELQKTAKKHYENYRRRGIKASLKELEKLAQLNPHVPELASLLADLYYNDGRIAIAYKWARKAVEMDKNQSLGWWIVGLVAYEAGRKTEYITAFREYLRLSPNDENAKQIRQLKIRELSNP